MYSGPCDTSTGTMWPGSLVAKASSPPAPRARYSVMKMEPPPATRLSTPNRPPPPANWVCVVIWMELPIQESSPASEMIESLGSSRNSRTGMVVPVMRLCISVSLYTVNDTTASRIRFRVGYPNVLCEGWPILPRSFAEGWGFYNSQRGGSRIFSPLCADLEYRGDRESHRSLRQTQASSELVEGSARPKHGQITGFAENPRKRRLKSGNNPRRFRRC